MDVEAKMDLKEKWEFLVLMPHAQQDLMDFQCQDVVGGQERSVDWLFKLLLITHIDVLGIAFTLYLYINRCVFLHSVEEKKWLVKSF